MSAYTVCLAQRGSDKATAACRQPGCALLSREVRGLGQFAGVFSGWYWSAKSSCDNTALDVDARSTGATAGGESCSEIFKLWWRKCLAEEWKWLTRSVESHRREIIFEAFLGCCHEAVVKTHRFCESKHCYLKALKWGNGKWKEPVCRGPSAVLCLKVKLLNYQRKKRKEGNIQPCLARDTWYLLRSVPRCFPLLKGR